MPPVDTRCVVATTAKEQTVTQRQPGAVALLRSSWFCKSHPQKPGCNQGVAQGSARALLKPRPCQPNGDHGRHAPKLRSGKKVHLPCDGGVSAATALKQSELKLDAATQRRSQAASRKPLARTGEDKAHRCNHVRHSAVRVSTPQKRNTCFSKPTTGIRSRGAREEYHVRIQLQPGAAAPGRVARGQSLPGPVAYQAMPQDGGLGLVSAGLCFWVWEVGGLGVAHLGAMLAHLGGYVGPSWGYVGPPWGLCCTGLRLGGPIFGVGGVGLVSDGLCL